MPEMLTLAVPLPATSTLRIADVDLNVRGSLIRIVFAEWAGGAWVENGREIIATWSGAPAESLILALNVANLSVKSLHRRVMEQAITDGKLAGAISGTP